MVSNYATGSLDSILPLQSSPFVLKLQPDRVSGTLPATKDAFAARWVGLVTLRQLSAVPILIRKGSQP